jgi:Cytochrome c oxidase subunit IV
VEDIVSDEPIQRKRAARRNRLSPEAMEQAAAAKRSYWPFLLAVSISISLVGIVLFSNIILIIGIVLVIGAIIGWGLERR